MSQAGQVSGGSGPVGTDLHVAKFIVGDTTNGANYSTIAAAIAAAPANSTIFLQDGIYTENLVFTKFMNIFSYGIGNSNVFIVGNATFPAGNVQVTFQGINFQNPSGSIATISGSNNVDVIYDHCYIQLYAGQLGFSVSNSSIFTFLTFQFCTGDISDGATKFFSFACPGDMFMYYNTLTNGDYTGTTSTTASTISQGSLTILDCNIPSGITSSSTAALYAYNCTWNTQGTFIGDAVQTWLTCGGSGPQIVSNCYFNSGSASAVSISSAATLSACDIASTASPAVAGTGTLNLGQIEFTGSSSSIAGTITIVPFISTEGTVNLNGGFAQNYRRVTGNTNVLLTDGIIGVNSIAPCNISLPAHNTGQFKGQQWIVKDESGNAGANNITVLGNGVNIDQSTQAVIGNNSGSYTIYWGGSQYYLI